MYVMHDIVIFFFWSIFTSQKYFTLYQYNHNVQLTKVVKMYFIIAKLTFNSALNHQL